MSGSLVSDPLVCCHFSFRVFSLVLMLTSLEVSQISSRIFQLAFQYQGGYRLCTSWLSTCTQLGQCLCFLHVTSLLLRRLLVVCGNSRVDST